MEVEVEVDITKVFPTLQSSETNEERVKALKDILLFFSHPNNSSISQFLLK